MFSFIRISKVAAAVMAVCALLASSCNKPEPEVSLSVKAQYEEVTAKADQMFISVKCSSSWTASLTDETGGNPVEWASLSAFAGNGDRNLILTYDGNPSEDQSRKIRVTVVSGDKTAIAVVEQTGSGVRPPEPEDPPVQNGTDLSKTGWMELPAMDNPDLEYYTHSFRMGGKTYRNYSFGWSQKDYTAVWVAYPLCRMYTNGNVGRSEDWNFDPLLGALWSPAPFDGYAGSYDRGHQIPSADRQCCYEANAQTYYGTNIVPQSNAHNTGIWQNLETKVRTIANNSDTTYVVTGVMIENPKEYTTDSTKDKDRVTRPKSELKTLPVPTHFFKAVLRYSKSSTLGQWNAAAFYLEHKSYSGNVAKEHSMSIDDLEEITGIDFFANLPAAVGESMAAKIEAVDPATSSVWW